MPPVWLRGFQSFDGPLPEVPEGPDPNDVLRGKLRGLRDQNLLRALRDPEEILRTLIGNPT